MFLISYAKMKWVLKLLVSIQRHIRNEVKRVIAP